MRRVALVLVLVAMALLAYFLLRGDKEVDAEAKYDGVHLCSPSQQKAATVAAGKSTAPRPSDSPEAQSQRTRGPLFAQNSPAWGGEEYDHGARQDVGCGTTLAQCGCAMTSVATVLALFQLMTTPDGDALNPSTLNSWFNEGAQLTDSGWVSQGYSYGNVVWTAVNNYSAGVADITASRSVRYAGWGGADEDEIKRQLAAGKKVVGEVPGHFIAIVGVQGDDILINDPYYADRTTLASYKGLLKSTRIYEVSDDLGGVMISVPANQRVKVTDSQGREVGTLGGKNPKDAEDDAKTEIPGAQYKFEEAWRDPTCTEKPPEDGQGVNSIFIPDPKDGNYKVKVLGEKNTSVAVHLYEEGGEHRQIFREGGDLLQFEFSYGTGGPGPSPTATPTATPTETPTPTPTPEPEVIAPPVEEEPTAVVTEEPLPDTPTVTLTPTATATPTVTPVPAPAMQMTPLNIVSALGSAIPGSPGCFTMMQWNSSGDPKGKVELLRNFVPIYTDGIGPKAFNDPFVLGTWTYMLRATNSDGVVTTSAPIQVTPACLVDYDSVIVDTCGDGCDHPKHSWKVLGNQSGTVKIVHAPDGVVVAAALPISSLSYIAFQDFNCPNDYLIIVTIGSWSVSSPVVRTPGGFFSNCND